MQKGTEKREKREEGRRELTGISVPDREISGELPICVSFGLGGERIPAGALALTYYITTTHKHIHKWAHRHTHTQNE